MQIDEFARRVANEYDYKLKTPKQLAMFKENCAEELWLYQGETLAAAWKEILRTHDKTIHPKMPIMLDICKKTKIRGNEERETTKPESSEALMQRQMIEEFKRSETFVKCCKARIAHDVLVHIGQKNEIPTDERMAEMATKAKEHDREFHEWDNNPNLDVMEKIMHKTAKNMRELNQEYYDEYVTKDRQ